MPSTSRTSQAAECPPLGRRQPRPNSPTLPSADSALGHWVAGLFRAARVSIAMARSLGLVPTRPRLNWSSPTLVIGTLPKFVAKLRCRREDARTGPAPGLHARGHAGQSRPRDRRGPRAHRPADADRLAPGEILVTAATTPAWTPLFSRAAAIATDGGSLVAVRERAGSPAGRRRPDVGGGGGNRLEAEPPQDRPAGRQRIDLKIAVAAGGGQARPVRDQGTEDPPAAPGRNGSPAPQPGEIGSAPPHRPRSRPPAAAGPDRQAGRSRRASTRRAYRERRSTAPARRSRHRRSPP